MYLAFSFKQQKTQARMRYTEEKLRVNFFLGKAFVSL